MLIFLPPPSSFLNPTPPSHLYSFYLPVSLSYSPSEHLCLLASLVVCPFPVPSLLFVTSISLSWCVPYLQSSSLLCPLCPRLSLCPIPPHPETFPFCCQPSLLILLSPPKNAFYALLQTNEIYLYLFQHTNVDVENHANIRYHLHTNAASSLLQSVDWYYCVGLIVD